METSERYATAIAHLQGHVDFLESQLASFERVAARHGKRYGRAQEAREEIAGFKDAIEYLKGS